MKKIFIHLALSAMLFALCSSAEAQQPTKVPRIGYLTGASLSAIAARIEAFRQGLRELGYVEGKNIVIEWRSAEGKLDRLPALAAELVRLKVDVIVTTGSSATRRRQGSNEHDSHCHDAMMAILLKPEFVASLARPGGNITGLSNPWPGAKRKTTGASERDDSQALPRGRLRDFDPAPATRKR